MLIAQKEMANWSTEYHLNTIFTVHHGHGVQVIKPGLQKHCNCIALQPNWVLSIPTHHGIPNQMER